MDRVTDGDGDAVLMSADEDDIVEDGEMDGIEILDDVGVDEFICKENYIRYQIIELLKKFTFDAGEEKLKGLKIGVSSSMS